ncbi:hypothetical protein JCM5296_002447 [Sporobolomyces johnsonii]
MVPASAAASYQPGKAPTLLDCSPSGLTSFLRSAKLFFRAKSIKEDEDKIAYLGAGLTYFPELQNWYLSSAAAHEAKKYDVFALELQKRALPRDYVWTTRGRIRSAKQGERDFEDWLDDLRSEHLALTEKVLPTRDFVEALLYGMDSELSAILRQGVALKGSGLHQDDLIAIAFSTTETVYPNTLDYDTFDREARIEWSKIATRRRSNAAQLKGLTRRTTSLAITTTSSPSSRSTPTSVTSARMTTTNPPGRSGNATRPPKLTELERDWLGATRGCFRCRKSYVDHKAKDCTVWAASDFIVPVPPGWDRTKPVPDANAPATTVTAGVRAVHALDDDNIDIPESFEDDSDTDTDGCAFPPLHLRLSLPRGGRSVLGLADSGSSVTLISDKLAKELGLVRKKLSKPKRCRVAIKGEVDYFIIHEFLRVSLSLVNGSWSAGLTTLLIAHVEEPFEVILGVPFIKRHRLSLSCTDPEQPRILAERGGGLNPYDLLAPTYGPATMVEALADERNGKEREALIAKVATAYAVELEEQVKTLTGEEQEMEERAARLMAEFDDLFPATLPPLTADYLARTTTRHRIRLENHDRVHNQRGFNIPRKWRESWKRMLEEHLAAGRL